MLTVTQAFLDALASSQEVSCTADLLKGGQMIYSGLPVTGGSVTLSRSQVANRQLACTLAPSLDLGRYASAPTRDRAGVYGHEIKVWWTLHFPGGGSESAPLGHFRVDSLQASLADDSAVQISGVSREAYVADDAFVTPRTVSGPSAQSLIGTLIAESLSGAQVLVRTSRDARVPTTTFDSSRWDAIKALADSISATVRCDGYGRFVLSDAPTVSTPAVLQLRTGPGGVLVGVDETVDRSRVRNCWIVQGSSPSSDVAPMQAVVQDSDPTSPTAYGDPDQGAFGRVPETRTVSTLSSWDQCQQLAAALLAQTCGAARTLSLKAVPNPAL